MYNYFFGGPKDSIKPPESLLDESNNLDNLMLDTVTKKVKYIEDFSNYTENKNKVCKITVILKYSNNTFDRRTYIGKYYENVANNKYYVYCHINLRPQYDVGKMYYGLEIYIDDKLDYDSRLSFSYKMNNSIINTLETVSVSKSSNNELIISVKRENDEYIMDNLKYTGIIL